MSDHRRTVVVLASYAPSLVLFREHLLRLLVERGYRVVCSAPHAGDVGTRLADIGVDFEGIDLARASVNPVADLAYVGAVRRLLKRLRPHAVLAYTAKPVIWGAVAARLAGVSRFMALITGLGFAFTSGEGRRRRMLAPVVEWLYRNALRSCSRVAFQNDDDQQEFQAMGLVVPAQSFVVNGSGVDLARFSVADLPSAPRFLMIARLLADKGVREYAEAARLVRSRAPESRFHLVGWYDDNPTAVRPTEVESWVARGDIEYLGHLEDVRPAIADSRVYVLPSYREGTPRTVLEAMAMGRPIITTDVPGCRSTVVEGWNGLLVPPRDAPALATAMERLIRAPDLAQEMGLRSREIAESRYEARAVANDLLEGFGL